MLCKIIVLIICIIFSQTDSAFALDTSAVSAIVIEASQNKIVYEKNAYKKMPMASTTKIMTALCAIEKGNIDDVITVNDNAVGIEGSSIYLAKGEKLTIRQLLYGLMLNSGNDAATAIAYAVSGSADEFANLMNQTAQKIGAKNTHFENPSGLDGKNHYTTAYDLALITSYAMKIPEFAEIVSTYKKNIPNGDKTYDRQLKNHNKLLKLYDGCIGVKTGFTKKSGRCLVSCAKRGAVTLVAVTLNDGNDWNDHTKMLDFGFEQFETKTIFKKGEYMLTVPVQKGNKKYVKLYAAEDTNVVVKKGEECNITLEYDVEKKAVAPVNYGSVFGKVSVYIKGIKSAVCRVEAVENIPAAETTNIFNNFSKILDLWINWVYT